MPSWSLHLAIAKKVNKKLKLNDDCNYPIDFWLP